MAKNRIDVTNVIVDGDSIWMLTANTDILCEFESDTLKLNSYNIIPCCQQLPYAHYSIAKNGNRVYVLPFQDNTMYVVETDSKRIVSKKIPFASEFENVYGKTIIAGCYENKLLFIGHNVKGIYIYDEMKDEFVVSMSYLEDLEKNGISSKNDRPLFSDCFIQIQNQLFIPVYKSGFIFIIDIVSEEHRIVKVGEGFLLKTIDLINGFEDRFILTTTDDRRLIWSATEGVIEDRKLNLLQGNEKYYLNAFYDNDKIIYIAACERKVFVEDNNSIKEIPFDYPENDQFPIGNVQFNVAFKFNGFVYVQQRYNGQFMSIDTNTSEIKYVDIKMDKDQLYEMNRKAYSQKKGVLLKESDNELDLENYINCVCLS